MELLLLDHVVSILEQSVYQLGALAFLRCELGDPQQRQQKLSEFPNCLALVENMVEDWTLRNCFLAQSSNPIANEALLWVHGLKPAHEQAHEWWINYLRTLQ